MVTMWKWSDITPVFRSPAETVIAPFFCDQLPHVKVERATWPRPGQEFAFSSNWNDTAFVLAFHLTLLRDASGY